MSDHKFSQLEKSILSTICYYDIFDYPLTSEEIWRYLYTGEQKEGLETDLNGVLEALEISGKLKEIIERYKKVHKSGLNLRYLDFSKGESETVSFSDFKDEIRQTSMFKEKKMVVITNPFLDIAFKSFDTDFLYCIL